MYKQETPQDVLESSLLNLEEELLKFKAAGVLLQEADENVKAFTLSFEKATAQLLDEIRKTVLNTLAITEDSRSLVNVVTPLISAIEKIDFPNRLNSIEKSTANQVTGLLKFQDGVEKSLDNMNILIKTSGENVVHALAKIEGAVDTQVKALLTFKGETERSLQALMMKVDKSNKTSLLIAGVGILNALFIMTIIAMKLLL
ncbi:MAG: hypothetical protein HGB26_01325 [Desulfobulbaceae bacterium]|nr:hypothetical protein [Desulfobulbaceae bacterium]